MKLNKSTIWAFFILVLAASLYRVWDARPFGFAPQVAMAIFGGAVIKDRRLALILPIGSLLISDILYQLLYVNGLTDIKGFYQGQWLNYLLFVGITCFGMLMKRINIKTIAGFTASGSILYFLASNFSVWIGGGGLGRPRTFEGLMLCYGDALAFYRDYGLINGFYGNQLLGDLFFGFLSFGVYQLVQSIIVRPAVTAN